MDFLRLVIKVPRVIPNENPKTNDNKCYVGNLASSMTLRHCWPQKTNPDVTNQYICKAPWIFQPSGQNYQL